MKRREEHPEREVFLTVPMLPNMELAVSKTAEALARLARFSQDQIDEIKHALIEACINAMEHSRSQDRKIFLTFKMFPNRLQVSVSDRGKGFDVQQTLLRKKAKVLEKLSKRGWGLMLIHNFMDDVEIHTDQNGTVIVMRKALSSPTQEGVANE